MRKQYVWIILLGIWAAISAAILMNTSGLAQSAAQGLALPQTARVILVAGRENVEPMFVPPPDEFTRLHTQTATFEINWLYGGGCQAVPVEARIAFQYAADIWATLIHSPVPITVDACWKDMGNPNILGGAGPVETWRDFLGAPWASTQYPVALANALYGSDINPRQADIEAEFNSAFSSWYFGTGSSTPIGKYNFVSVALHELCHGLGFISSLQRYGETNSATWGWETSYPVIMDRFIENGSWQTLVNQYPTANELPSAALYSELIGGNIWFNGPYADQANGGGRVRLYAPGTWSSGSSISHLDYDTYGGGPNTLMVYALNAGATVHDPGPVTKGILKDIGWKFEAPPTPTPTFTPTPTATPTPKVTVIPASGGSLTAIHETTTTVQFPDESLPWDIRVTLGFTDVTGYDVKLAPVKPGLFLSAIRVSDSQPVYELASPFTMIINYDERDIWSIKENTLMMYYWDSSQWITATQTCSPTSSFTHNAPGNQVIVQVCDLARYALMGETERVFFPITMKSTSP